MNLIAPITTLKVACRLGSLFFILILSHCATSPPVAEDPEGKSKKIRMVRSITRWPTDVKWWTSPGALALSKKSGLESFYGFEARVGETTPNEDGTTTIRLNAEEKKPFTVSLIGPGSLINYLTIGQKVAVSINSDAQIAGLGGLAEIVSWERKQGHHKLSIRPHGTFEGYSEGKPFPIVLAEGQLFRAFGPSESAYFEMEMEKIAGRKYFQFSQQEKLAFLNQAQELEFYILPQGICCYSGAEYGGGEEDELEWVISQPASEGFD